MKTKIPLVTLMVVVIGLFASVKSSSKENNPEKVEVGSTKREVVANATIIPPVTITPPVRG